MTTLARGRSRNAAETESPHAPRLKRLGTLIAAQDAEALLVTNPNDVGYLTGFLGGDSYLLVPARGVRGRPVILSDFRYQEELEPVKSLAEVFIRTGSLTSAVAQVVGGRGLKRLAIQAEHATVAQRDALAKAMRGVKLSAATGLVGALRARKDAHEVKLIRRAIKIQQEALLAVLPTIKPGQTELEVAARLEAEMKSRGSSQPGFQTIVAARANGSLPHYRPGPVRIAANQPLLIDWGAVYGGYHGDMTRTFALGRWPKKIAEIYRIVLDAQLMAADALAPGKSTVEIDAVARDYIARHGYGEQFGHGLGHGMGLDGHEDPRLNRMFASAELEPGHVVTVEPGIYLPGVGGVRIEDDYLITETGAKNLCSLPKDMEWATL